MPEDDIRKLQSKFYRDREIIRVKANKLYDDSRWFQDSEGVRLKNYLTPMVIADPTNDDIPQMVDGDALRTIQKGVIYEDYQAAAGVASAIAMPADERREIMGVFAYLDTDANVANRDFEVQIGIAIEVMAAVMYVWQTAPIVITANQVGGFWMPGGPTMYTNTNNVFAAVVGANPVPFITEGTSIIAATSTNIQVGDQFTIAIWYRRVD